jgi:outer membrane protein assembly factor BamB
MGCIFAFFTLRRFDGLRGAQTGDMSWRWTATHEQDFMSAHAAAAKHVAAASETKKWTPQPGDCSEFRGPGRDGVLTGVSIVPDWQEHLPKLLWKKKVGPGWSGMIVVDGHLVTQEQRGEVESVVCYDAATGDELWAHDDHVRFEESLAGAGPRGTPTFADGRIFALGGRGTLNCLVPETGAVLWSRDIMKDGEVQPSDMPQWGYSVSPLVVDDLVIVFAGGTKDKSIIAYKVADGSIAWARPGGKQSYSSPQLATLGGKKQIAMHDTSAIRVLNISDGAEQWSKANESELALPMLQPHVVPPNDLVVSTSPGMARFVVTGERDDTAAPRWTTNKLRPDFSDFVIHKGLLYGLNNGILCCLDLESGDLLWKKSRLGFGQIVLLGDQDALLVSNEKGEIILVAVDRKGPKELGRFQAIEGKTWNGPVLVGNRVFLRNAAEMAAYELNVQNSSSPSSARALPTNSL